MVVQFLGKEEVASSSLAAGTNTYEGPIPSCGSNVLVVKPDITQVYETCSGGSNPSEDANMFL